MAALPPTPNTLYYPHLDSHIAPTSNVSKLPAVPVTTQIQRFLKRKYNIGSAKYSLSQIVPALTLFNKPYTLTDLWVDALAGVTLSTVLIPQSLSYAILAGLTAQYGLYAAFISPLIYFFLGTTRELSVGPFALVSIIVAQIVNTMYPDLLALEEINPALGLQARLGYTMALTFATSFWFIIMAICKLGWVIDLVSSPGVEGLIMATALSVSASQLGALFGIHTGQGSFLSCVIGLLKGLGETNFVSLVFGTIGIVVLIAADQYSSKKKLKVPLPSQITLVIVATAISALFNLHDNFGVKVVGTIPMGFVSSVLPNWTELFTNIDFWINSFLVAVVGFVISSSVSQQMSQQNKYKVNFNSELFALGVASFIGSFTNSYISSASLSRTSVVNSCKPRTRVWSLWTCLIILAVILFLGPLLYHLPSCILAAVVIGAFRGQFLKYDQFLVYWKQSQRESLVYLSTLLVTLLVSIQAGLIAAFASSLFSVILDQAGFKPTFLTQIPNTQRFVHYHRLPLSPYYTFLDEIEGQGGLSKRRQPRGSVKFNGYAGSDDDAQIQNHDSATDLSGLGDTTHNNSTDFEDSGYDSDYTNTTRNPFDLNFNDDPSHYSQQIDASNDVAVTVNNISDENDASIPTHIVLTDPRVVVLHFGKQITFLNSNPVSEYITRYIDMFQEYTKKRGQLLPNHLKHYLRSPHSPSTPTTPSSSLPLEPNDNDNQDSGGTGLDGIDENDPNHNPGSFKKSSSILYDSSNTGITTASSDLHHTVNNGRNRSTNKPSNSPPIHYDDLERPNDGERRTDGPVDDDYLTIAPQLLVQQLINPAFNSAFQIRPIITNIHNRKSVDADLRQSDGNANAQGGDNATIQPYNHMYGNDIIVSPHLQDQTNLMLNNGPTIIDPYNMTFDDEYIDEADDIMMMTHGENNNNIISNFHSEASKSNHNQSSLRQKQFPKTLSTLSTLSSVHKLRFPPPSPSTTTTLPQILFNTTTSMQSTSSTTPQGLLFTTMIFDTITLFTAEQIAKYELVIICDQLMGVDLTGKAMLKKLSVQFPFVLFLFSNPSIQLVNSHLAALTSPMNFINHNIYLTVEFAKYFLDMAIASRLYQKRIEIEQISQDNLH